MISSLLKDRPHRTHICTRNQEMAGGPGSIEELLASKEFYPIMTAMLRPISVAMNLPAGHIEDVMQEASLAILEYLDRYGNDVIQRWRSWMRQVVRNKTVDALRQVHLGIVSLDASAIEPIAPESEEADTDRERQLAWVGERLEETAADESLNGRLLRGRFVEGRTNARLAEEEGLTEKAVECRICRRIAELRQKAVEDGLIGPQVRRIARGTKVQRS